MESIYLHAALTGPDIHMFDMHRKQEIVVKDFTSYPSEFPFKDPSCLTRPGYNAAEIQEMHQDAIEQTKNCRVLIIRTHHQNTNEENQHRSGNAPSVSSCVP